MLPADLSLSVAERVDAACDHFETEWKQGNSPQIEALVAAAPASDREELRQALVALQHELQAKSAAETSVSQSSVCTVSNPSPTATTAHSSAPTATNIGRFEVRSVLGSGAFGKVYRAFDPQLGREVAVKVPLEETVKSEGDRARFLKEARSAGNINHPNVCQVHEVGEADGRPYIVMTLVRGQSLAETIKTRKSPLPPKQIALVVRKIALALAAAHDNGIVHRDLKPANIMFDRERKDIVVMDFGLARGPRMGDARGTQSGIIMGTPAYMSPEQARGDAKGVGPEGDIFSLGVILYELLTGIRPFTGTATEVIGKILHVDPEKPSTLRAEVAPRLEAICLKAMAKDPADRFASMKAFAAELDTYLRKPDPEADTVKSQQTRHDDADSSTGQQLADVFAALSHDRQQVRAETAAAVEAAVAKFRTPRWVFVALGLVLLMGFVSLGIIFFTRSQALKADLAVIINEVDLKDPTLRFFLDDEPIAAEQLAKPVELQPGVHIFTVKRGKEIIERFEIRVAGGKEPGIKVEKITPPRTKVAKQQPQRQLLERKPSPLDRLKRDEVSNQLVSQIFGSHDNVPKELVALSDAVSIDQKDLKENYFGGFALDRTGGMLASGRYPFTVIQLHALGHGEMYKTIATDPGGWIDWIRIAPDNESIYYQRRSSKLFACNFNGKILWQQAVRAENYSVPALSPDGQMLVAADPDLTENTLNVFDTKTGNLTASWKGIIEKPQCRLTFSPDGTMLAAQSGGVVKFVNPKDGSLLPITPIERTSGEPRFSPDSKRLYWSVSWRQPEDYCVEYEIATGKRTEYRRAPAGCCDIIPNPVYPILATNDTAGHLHFWDASLGPDQQPYVISTGGVKVERMLFTPEGGYLVVGAHNLIMVFRLPVDRPVSEWGSPSPVQPTTDINRRVAELVIDLGGQLGIDRPSAISMTKAELPSSPFNVEAIVLNDKPHAVLPEHFALFAKLPALKVLHMHRSPFAGAGLAQLAASQSLEEFDPADCKLSDAVLAPLATMTSLKRLNLTGNPNISNEGLAIIARIKNLDALVLHSTLANHVGLEHLANNGVPRTRLNVMLPTFGERGMKAIARIASLRFLGITITSEGTADEISPLTACRNLDNLLIRSRHLDDQAVPHLSKLTSLKRLELTETSITPRGLQQLKAALPGCEIVPKPPEGP